MAFHGDAAEIGAVATEAEARGVGGLFVAEAAHDPYIALALAGQATSRIRIGSSVAIAFARTPMSTAYSAWDVHRLSGAGGPANNEGVAVGGRLVLGLGTQIKPHITRRFDMPWSSPAPRMAEYVAALRSIFDSFQNGTRLDFQGDFYQHTLLPPLFNPGPIDGGPPPIWLAAVGPKMLATAGAVADGLICHPLLSRSYLDEVIVPTVTAGRAGGAHAGEPFTTSVLCMVATGRTEEDLALAIAGTKRQIGFYASTPAYKPVLDHHGWGDLHAEAHAYTKSGRWTELGDLVPDEVLNMFAVVGDLDTARAEFRSRFAGSAQRVITSINYDTDNHLALDLVSE
ncbi:LLM class F420-dependent oxidoreductase [Aeromicrobium panaciterrae]